MTRTTVRQGSTLLLFLLVGSWGIYGQKKPKPGFNLFSKEQDIQIGQEGMKEIEKQVKLANNREVNEYIQRIGKKLVEAPEADNYPYTFKVVYDEAVNAFALPGGPTYVNTGLILAAENEAQLAGVMGHEIAHVALRHGTNQASKANLFQLGAMIGGSVAATKGGTLGTLAQLGIGFGGNSVLLKFSRGAERSADILGAYIMARAGYNPIEAARFFEKLQETAGDKSKVEEFFSSHPNPGNRTARIEREIQYMPRRAYDGDTGQLARIQAIVRDMKPPKGPPAAEQPGAQPRGPGPVSRKPSAGPRQPGSGQQVYQGREFALSYPGDWRAYADQDQASVTFAPADGIVPSRNGGSAVARGVIASKFPIERGRRADLQRDTQQLIDQLRQGNPSIRVAGRQPRRLRVDSKPALLTTMYSDSPIANETEVDLLLTVTTRTGLYYAVFIAPQREFRYHQPNFEDILKSIQITN